MGDRTSALNELRHHELRTLSRLRPSRCVRLAAWLDDAGHHLAAGSVLRQCIAAHRRDTDSRELAALYLALGQLRLREGQHTAAYQHLLTALDLDPSPETERLARAALERIDVYRR